MYYPHLCRPEWRIAFLSTAQLRKEGRLGRMSFQGVVGRESSVLVVCQPSQWWNLLQRVMQMEWDLVRSHLYAFANQAMEQKDVSLAIFDMYF